MDNLETFLGGMETSVPDRTYCKSGGLETFLGGMETAGRPEALGCGP